MKRSLPTLAAAYETALLDVMAEWRKYVDAGRPDKVPRRYILMLRRCEVMKRLIHALTDHPEPAFELVSTPPEE